MIHVSVTELYMFLERFMAVEILLERTSSKDRVLVLTAKVLVGLLHVPAVKETGVQRRVSSIVGSTMRGRLNTGSAMSTYGISDVYGGKH